jgi:hypothetical protein
MMYILSEEEYRELTAKKATGIGLSEEKLQTLCTEIANEMPVVWGWGGPDPKPWKCIITAKYEWYCDNCPVQAICPNEDKEWSK